MKKAIINKMLELSEISEIKKTKKILHIAHSNGLKRLKRKLILPNMLSGSECESAVFTSTNPFLYYIHANKFDNNNGKQTAAPVLLAYLILVVRHLFFLTLAIDDHISYDKSACKQIHHPIWNVLPNHYCSPLFIICLEV